MLIFFSSNMIIRGLKFQINSQTYLGNHFIILSWKVDSPQGHSGAETGHCEGQGVETKSQPERTYVSWSHENE